VEEVFPRRETRGEMNDRLAGGDGEEIDVGGRSEIINI